MTLTPVADPAIKQTYRMIDIIYCDDKEYRAILIALELAYAATLVRVKAAVEQGIEISTKDIIDDYLYIFSIVLEAELVRHINKMIDKINNNEV